MASIHHLGGILLNPRFCFAHIILFKPPYVSLFHHLQFPIILPRPRKTKAREGKASTTHHSQILHRPRRPNILQRRLQLHHLLIHPPLRLHRAIHRLGLKRLNRLQLPAEIEFLRAELLHFPLDLVHDRRVGEQGAVVREIDGLGLGLQEGEFAAGVVVALFEGCEGRGGSAC